MTIDELRAVWPGVRLVGDSGECVLAAVRGDSHIVAYGSADEVDARLRELRDALTIDASGIPTRLIRRPD